MKINKKLSKGMTLVEVIVAMTIFAVMAATIIDMVSFSMQQTVRNRKRDMEIGQQDNAVGKKSGMEMTNITPASEVNGYTISFIPEGSATVTVDGVNIYAADAAQFGKDFGFRMRMVHSGALDSLSTTNNNVGEYKFIIKNDFTESVTAYVTLNEGVVYEGNRNNGYIHTSASYLRTIPSSGNCDFGYYNTSYGGVTDSGDITMYFVSESNATATLTIDPTHFDEDVRTVQIHIAEVGGAPIVDSITYPT